MSKLISGKFYLVKDSNNIIQASETDVRGAAVTNTEHLYEEVSELQFKKFIMSKLIDSDHKMHETVAYIAAEIYSYVIYRKQFEYYFSSRTHGFKERLSEIIAMAKEFELMHIETDWDNVDWYTTLNKFILSKIKSLD